MEFKKGDRVRILRKARTHERGWQNSWIHPMTKTVGKIGKVVYVGTEFRHDVEVKVPGDEGTWGYPDFILRKVFTPIKRKKAS
jgi:hypothetical protein